MQITTLGYHDIVESLSAAPADSRVAAAHYALDRATFRRHLEALRDAGMAAGATLPSTDRTLILTFDDGAEGGYSVAAEELERQGWRGFFFITTNWIDTPGFMTRRQIAELHQRGHTIGSHTQSHPRRMSSLTWNQLLEEWGISRQILSDIVGAPVWSASVADGYYSRQVGLSAAQSGLTALFTSEPTTHVILLDSCQILGRYSVFAGSTSQEAVALAAGRGLARARQWTSWQAKKCVKKLAGEQYLAIRRVLLSRKDQS